MRVQVGEMMRFDITTRIIKNDPLFVNYAMYLLRNNTSSELFNLVRGDLIPALKAGTTLFIKEDLYFRNFVLRFIGNHPSTSIPLPIKEFIECAIKLLTQYGFKHEAFLLLEDLTFTNIVGKSNFCFPEEYLSKLKDMNDIKIALALITLGVRTKTNTLEHSLTLIEKNPLKALRTIHANKDALNDYYATLILTIAANSHCNEVFIKGLLDHLLEKNITIYLDDVKFNLLQLVTCLDDVNYKFKKFPKCLDAVNEELFLVSIMQGYPVKSIADCVTVAERIIGLSPENFSDSRDQWGMAWAYLMLAIHADGFSEEKDADSIIRLKNYCLLTFLDLQGLHANPACILPDLETIQKSDIEKYLYMINQDCIAEDSKDFEDFVKKVSWIRINLDLGHSDKALLMSVRISDSNPHDLYALGKYYFDVAIKEVEHKKEYLSLARQQLIAAAKKDFHPAITFLETTFAAADQLNCAETQYFLGYHYEERDNTKALSYYQAAINNQHPEAEFAYYKLLGENEETVGEVVAKAKQKNRAAFDALKEQRYPWLTFGYIEVCIFRHDFTQASKDIHTVIDKYWVIKRLTWINFIEQVVIQMPLAFKVSILLRLLVIYHFEPDNEIKLYCLKQICDINKNDEYSDQIIKTLEKFNFPEAKLELLKLYYRQNIYEEAVNLFFAFEHDDFSREVFNEQIALLRDPDFRAHLTHSQIFNFIRSHRPYFITLGADLVSELAEEVKKEILLPHQCLIDLLLGIHDEGKKLRDSIKNISGPALYIDNIWANNTTKFYSACQQRANHVPQDIALALFRESAHEGNSLAFKIVKLLKHPSKYEKLNKIWETCSENTFNEKIIKFLIKASKPANLSQHALKKMGLFPTSRLIDAFINDLSSKGFLSSKQFIMTMEDWLEKYLTDNKHHSKLMKDPSFKALAFVVLKLTENLDAPLPSPTHYSYK